MDRRTMAITGLALALLLAGCAAIEPTPPVPPTVTPVPAAVTSGPSTETPAPTVTPIPATQTSTPTATSIPPTHILAPTATPMPPTVTPTSILPPPLSAAGGGVIAFSSDRSGKPGIYVMNADGSDQRLVTDEGNAAYASFSPDGARLIYVASLPNMGRVYTINVDGSERQEMFSQNRSMSDPDWSPDGEQIVFILHTHQYFSISVMGAGSRSPRALTRPVTNQINSAPGWSPDGQRIVFSSDRDGDDEIYTMDANGGNVQQMTDNDTTDWWPAWSPDGSQITFTAHRDRNWDIYVMDSYGGKVRRLTDNPANDRAAAWSPDGARIAFASDRDGNWEIYVMDADGSQPRRITANEAQDTYPVWRPY